LYRLRTLGLGADEFAEHAVALSRLKRLAFLSLLQVCHIPPGGIACGRNSSMHETQGMSGHEHGHQHQSHSDIIKRLKRAEGHLRSIVSMIEDSRACVDIAQQLHAVEKAVCQAKRTLIQDHIDHCLEHTVEALATGERASLEDFKQITKYL
jgi:DNA-binding FrmR family transcriptional regulator